MIVIGVLVVAAACWPSVHLLVRYYQKPEEKPKAAEAAGIVVATVGMAAFLVALLVSGLFF